MAGQPTPPRLVEPFANNAPVCTQAAPVAGGKTLPLPVASQITVLNGAASLADGFPPLTMTNPGGTPPFGIDENGILFVISSWAAFFAAGQYPAYDATLQAAMGGYAKGARVQQAANPLAFWTSNTVGNMANPDTGGAGWISSTALYSAAALTGTNDVALPGASDYVINIAAAVTFTGFVAQRDGQKITFVFTGGSGLLEFTPLATSAAANQISASGTLGYNPNDSVTIQYSTGFGKWLVV